MVWVGQGTVHTWFRFQEQNEEEEEGHVVQRVTWCLPAPEALAGALTRPPHPWLY